MTMKIIQKGISNNLIQFNKDKTHITYLMLNKTRRYTNPEEQVQVMAYLSLIFDYGYDPKHIAMFVPVKMGSATREADIIVYHDERHKSPHIVVECKHADASAKAFGEGMKQAFSYAHAIKAKFIWVTSQINNKYFDTSQAHAMDIVACEIPDIPKLGGNVLPYKFTKGGVNGTELQVVTQDELTRIFKYAHDTIWAGGKRNPTQAFDELDKLIFCKLWDETRIMRKLGEPYHFQLYLKEPPDELEKRIKGLYELGRQKSAEVFQDDIRLSAEELQTVVSYLARVNLNDTDLDSKGRAFETFMGSFFRGDFGQYFTPRQIVKFIVDVMPIKNDSLVLDVACGSGGFLLYALDKIRNKADSMVHESYFIRNSHQHRDYWHKFAEHNLYGMEISEMIARVAKMNMIVHDDGHTNVVSVDTLQGMDEVRLITKNNGFENDRFDFILTNPPFGSKIKFEEHRYMEDYELGMKGRNWIDERLKPRAEQVRDSQSSEILFLEQCHNLLKPDGMLAIVMPDGILTNSSLQYARDWLGEKFRIIAVISMPQTAFTATGAGVKSSVLFLQKYAHAKTVSIQESKRKIQESLFDEDRFDKTFKQLEKDKKHALKKGDAIMQNIEIDMVAKIEAMREQFEDADVDLKGMEHAIKSESKQKIKIHKQSEQFKAWRKETTNLWNEKIGDLKETLSEDYMAKVQTELEDYPIFMAIAEEIGYDATGKPTATNELDIIARELKRFMADMDNADFFVSPDVDENKIFIMHRGDLEGRIDPNFYKPEFRQLDGVLESIEHTKLGQLAWFSTETWNQIDLFEDRFPYIEISEININSGQIQNITYYEIEKAPSRAKMIVREHDIIISTTRPHRGAITLIDHENDGFIASTGFAVLRGFHNKVSREYILHVLRSKLCLKQMLRRSSGGNYPAITTDELKNILIPLPPMSIQNAIVNCMQTAYAEKHAKEAEAAGLLDSIDGYLLEKLGIVMPETRKVFKNLSCLSPDRMFITKFGEVHGGRLDPSTYERKNKMWLDAFNKSFYSIKKLREISQIILQGVGQNLTSDDSFTLLKVKNILPNNGIDFKNIEYVKNVPMPKILQTGDIITPFIGEAIRKFKFSVFPLVEKRYTVDNNTGIIRLKKVILPDYVASFFATRAGHWQIEQLIGGSVPFIGSNNAKKLLIPLPPMSIQNEIVADITAMREQAKQLQAESVACVEAAKAEMEVKLGGSKQALTLQGEIKICQINTLSPMG